MGYGSKLSWYAKWEIAKEEREEQARLSREEAEHKASQEKAELERHIKAETAEPVLKKTEPLKLYEGKNGQLSFFEPVQKSNKKGVSKPHSMKDLLLELEEKENY